MSDQLAVASPPTRRQRMVAPALTIGGLAAATAALHLRDPHESGSWGFCPTAAVGFACPGCGGLRAVNDLTHLDLAAAASSNLALVVALPFIVAAIALWTVRRWRDDRLRADWQLRQRVAFAGLGLLAVFTVLRNLPVGTWLAP
ncbi:DUF2752 domain-containing protein [Nocardioides sp. W7]|uniref:DUF2752 domain-containing protein n=1 Tax=Nocardioides sp. W7 TaxID=2931390 RepID=UPI001FD0A447|nr:DUF2752 domain-containing protein [Nocardioides sp. W7]